MDDVSCSKAVSGASKLFSLLPRVYFNIKDSLQRVKSYKKLPQSIWASSIGCLCFPSPLVTLPCLWNQTTVFAWQGAATWRSGDDQVGCPNPSWHTHILGGWMPYSPSTLLLTKELNNYYLKKKNFCHGISFCRMHNSKPQFFIPPLCTSSICAIGTYLKQLSKKICLRFKDKQVYSKLSNGLFFLFFCCQKKKTKGSNKKRHSSYFIVYV